MHSYQDILNSIGELQETNYQVNTELSNIETTFSLLRAELKPTQQAKFLIDCEQKDLYGSLKIAFEHNFGQ